MKSSNNTDILEGTDGTQGTVMDQKSSDVLPLNIAIENTENKTLNLIPVNPIDQPSENLLEPQIKRPSYRSHSDWFILNGKKFRPGLYWHNECLTKEGEVIYIDEWICSPLSVEGITSTREGSNFGRLLKFKDSYGKWHQWAMPMYLLKSAGDELRGELLDQGLELNISKRGKILEYIMQERSKRRIIAATNTGWHEGSFVLPNRVIGSADVVFQSEQIGDSEYSSAGTLKGWQEEIAVYCQGNIPLTVSISAALAGALLQRIQYPGGGIHWKGDSSSGKSTAVEVGASVWGSPQFVKSWSATANGLEGAAASRNDTCLILDEIDQALPSEVGKISYMLVNGQGKQRAGKIGNACKIQRWRLMTISTGERTITEIMGEIGKKPNAGQLVRLLSIPANFTYGIFSNLHHFKDGRSFSDYLKQARYRNYGHAGEAFIRALIDDKQDLGEAISILKDEFSSKVETSLEKRAASVFACIALAGELAIKYGILPWSEGDAKFAAEIAFERWLDNQGKFNTEDHQILQNINDFLDKHGSSRFSARQPKDLYDKTIINRAGWFEDERDIRLYYFIGVALAEAGGFDQKRVVQALDKAGWIIDHDPGKKTKKTRTPEGLKNLYYIKTKEII